MRTDDTKLSDVEEQGYHAWLSKIGQAPGMGAIDKNWTHKSYDLRGVYKKYGPVDIRGKKIPDEFKKQEDLTQGPKDTQENWAKKSNDNMGSHDVAPWYDAGTGSDAGSSKFDMGEDVPWAGKNG